MDESYIDSGASYRLIPSQVALHTYQKFVKPFMTSAADSGMVYAYNSGTLQAALFVSGQECKADLQEVYYIPETYV